MNFSKILKSGWSWAVILLGIAAVLTVIAYNETNPGSPAASPPPSQVSAPAPASPSATASQESPESSPPHASAQPAPTSQAASPAPRKIPFLSPAPDMSPTTLAQWKKAVAGLVIPTSSPDSTDTGPGSQIQIPLAFQPVDPASLTPEMQIKLAQLQNEFMQAVSGGNGSPPDPSSPAYKQHWISAQELLDEEFRADFGWQAFNQMQAVRAQTQYAQSIK